MDNNMISTYKFKASDGIENIIEKWANSSGFHESILPRQLDPNDITYCFSLDEDGEKTLLTVNILDSIVYIETWVMASTTKNKVAFEQINNLFKQIKSETYVNMN